MKQLAVLLFAGLVLVGCGGEPGQPDANAQADGNEVTGDPALVIPGVGGASPSPNSLPGLPPTSAPAIPIVRRADTTVREPAVAGTWYPYDPNTLRRVVDSGLSMANAAVGEKVRAVIAPHAGYQFSGLTVAAAYKQIMGQDVDTAVLMACSHFAKFQGASVAKFAAYRTPLGDVAVSPKAAQLAKTPPFVLSPAAEVKRPWKTPSKLPPSGGDTPHTWEHTIEAHLPFLQWAAPGCQIVPVQFGQGVNPSEAAAALTPLIDEKTVLVASTDLSHYHPYDEAKAIDAWFVKAVNEMDLATMASANTEACGKEAVLTVMQIAKERGWKPRVLDYRTSGDVRGGDKKRVVGYVAAVFVEEGTVKIPPLTAEEGKLLVGLARQTIIDAITKKRVAVPNRSTLPRKLLAGKAVFVTINKKDELRGCIGTTLALQPLYRGVVEKAANAALRDRRFKPVTAEEFKDLTVEVSVLTTPKSIYYNQPSDLLTKLRPKVDGVVLEIPIRINNRQASAQAVFLPTVWEEIPDPAEFMSRLTLKAKRSLEIRLSVQAKKQVRVNLAPNAWRGQQARIRTFQTENFEGPLIEG